MSMIEQNNGGRLGEVLVQAVGSHNFKTNEIIISTLSVNKTYDLEHKHTNVFDMGT